MPSDDARFGAAVRELLRASHGLFPDDVPATVREIAIRHLGARDLQLFLVDLDQVELRAFDPGLPADAPLPVDTTAAGLAFREERPVIEQLADGERMWLPVLDSAERLGVIGVVADGELPMSTWTDYASLIGELVMGKRAYGDSMSMLQRTGQLSVAAEMRWSMLPPLTFSSPAVSISGILQPSRLIAGDAFDYAVTDRTASVAIFDAMGHGLEASRMANLAIGAYRNQRRGGAGLTDALVAIDAVLDEQFGEARFVTAQLASLDLDSGELRIASAGHPAPVVLRGGSAPDPVEVRPCRPVGLGYEPCPPSVVQLEANDAVLLHTDGVSEARSPSGDVYGEERLARRCADLLEARHRPAEVLRQLIHEVIDFQGERVRDDCSLVFVRWRPDPANVEGPPDADPIVVT